MNIYIYIVHCCTITLLSNVVHCCQLLSSLISIVVHCLELEVFSFLFLFLIFKIVGWKFSFFSICEIFKRILFLLLIFKIVKENFFLLLIYEILFTVSLSLHVKNASYFREKYAFLVFPRKDFGDPPSPPPPRNVTKLPQT